MKLCADLRVSIASNDAGCEECVAATSIRRQFLSNKNNTCIPVSWNNQSEIHEASNKDLKIFENIHDVFDADRAFCGASSLVLA